MADSANECSASQLHLSKQAKAPPKNSRKCPLGLAGAGVTIRRLVPSAFVCKWAYISCLGTRPGLSTIINTVHCKYSYYVILTLLSWGWPFASSHTTCSLHSWCRGRRRLSCSRACPGPQRCPQSWAQMCSLWTRRSERWVWPPLDFPSQTWSSILTMLASRYNVHRTPC